MIKAECDRCGRQEEVNASVVAVPGIAFMREPALPEDWRRVAFPVAEPGAKDERKHLCERCVNALALFLVGDGAVPGLLEEAGQERVVVHLEETGVAGAEYRVASIDGCTCPKPVEPTPPCPVHEQDPRPNLTERAERIAGMKTGQRCVCAGAGFGTEDCPLHHPDGLEKGTHLKCYQDPEGKECPGIYRRGLFREHMSRWHGIPVAEGSKACPYCAEITKGITQLGPHIAKEHPGQWELWRSGGQIAG